MNDKPLSQFALLLLVRDARVVHHADRLLLDALILRCNPAKRYMSWPSYVQLAEDTNLSAKTLRRAAISLEAADLVSRKVRANRSNLWFVNAAKIQALGLEARSLRPRRPAPDEEECPFEAPVQDQGEEIPEQVAAEDSDDFLFGGAR